MDQLRIASAQINPIVGDIAGNAGQIRAARARAAHAGAQLVVTPELSILGYPPEDLVLRPAVVSACQDMVAQLAAETADGGPAVVLGAPWREGGRLHNGVLLLEAGRVAAVRFKRELPNYGVFDEKRVFEPGPLPETVDWRGLRFGLPVCEDIWLPDAPRGLIRQGAEIIVCINGSPWRRTILEERNRAFRVWFAGAGVPLLYVNEVCGQDELVFDGGSFIWNADGSWAQLLASFAADFAISVWRRADGGWRAEQGRVEAAPEGPEADWRAICLAIKDYVEKNRFPGVVLGLSGGVDSALTAALAVDALGPERVRCLRLPSRYTSAASMEDAAAIAERLGCRLDTISIEPLAEGVAAALAPLGEGEDGGLAAENAQSRLRGLVLMAVSNRFGPMVLTTGNKSELAVGYATLYGDMNGGYNPLKDLWKTEVYALARWRNGAKLSGLLGPEGPVIPDRVLTRAPSAELRENQTDQDSLPPYDVLDAILKGLVERGESRADLARRGFERATVDRVAHMVRRAEHKRRQAAPGPKIGGRSFGRDWRYPITQRWGEG